MVQSYHGDIDATEFLQTRSYLPIDQVDFIPEATHETIRTIEIGVVFLMAFWSGPAVDAFSLVTKQLAKNENRNIRLLVVDTDGAASFEEYSELRPWLIAGNGPTAWVRDGAIAEVTLPLSDLKRIGELAQGFFEV